MELSRTNVDVLVAGFPSGSLPHLGSVGTLNGTLTGIATGGAHVEGWLNRAPLNVQNSPIDRRTVSSTDRFAHI